MEQITHKTSYYIINGITMYRVITAPLLVVLLLYGQYEIFKWLLGVSFFTDLIDGYLARKYKVTSVFGARLDSIGDDLTVLVALLGLVIMKPDFIREQKWVFIIIGILFVIQTSFALIRYKKITSFHTYLAKAAALLQGVFLLLVFFFREPNLFLFYTAAIVTMVELVEETILVYLLPQWTTNIKGLFWIPKNNAADPKL